MTMADIAYEVPRRQPVWSVLVLLCYAAFAGAAVSWSHSVSGWIVLGLAPALLIDRLIFRILPPHGDSIVTQFCIRLGYFLFGLVAFTFFTEGSITVMETVFVSLVLSLATFLLEYLLELAFYLYYRVRGMAGVQRMGPVQLAGLAAALALPLVVFHPLLAVHPVRRVAGQTPADLGAPFEEIQFTTPDGLILEGWFIPAQDARAVAIYCHGYGENRGQSLTILRALRKMGLDVLAFDFRGHGTSEGHTVTFGYREVNDLKAALAQARQLAPGKPVFIIGVSYGAAATLHALPELGDIQGVWVDSTFGRFQSVLDRSFGFLPDSLRPTFTRVASAMIRLDCGVETATINPIDRLEHVRVPIYFCHWRGDPVTSFEEGKELFDRYQGPKWSYWVDDVSLQQTLSTAGKREYYRRLYQFVNSCLHDGSHKSAGAETALTDNPPTDNPPTESAAADGTTNNKAPDDDDFGSNPPNPSAIQGGSAGNQAVSAQSIGAAREPAAIPQAAPAQAVTGE